MGKISGLEDVRQLPPKVCRMYQAVLQMLEEGLEVSDMRVLAITERAGIGKGTAYEYFDSKEDLVTCAVMYQVKCMSEWLEAALEERGSFREQLRFLLDEVEKKERFQSCFQRLLTMMADRSEFNRMLQKRMSAEVFLPYLPVNVFRRVLGRGVERGDLRGDLPLDYMVHCLFAHLLIYMAEIAEECCLAYTAVTQSLVYQGILNELEAIDGTAAPSL